MENNTRMAPGWRMDALLRVLTFIFVLASLMSAYSTGKGMVTTFFSKNALLAYAASAIIQLTEIVNAGKLHGKNIAAFLIAFAISVSLSALQFVDAAYTIAKYSTLAQHALNEAYSQMLPEIQSDAAEQMTTLRSSLFDDLDAIRQMVDRADTESGTAPGLDAASKAAILDAYQTRADSYPENYEQNAMYRNLVSILDMAENGQDPAAVVETIEHSLTNLEQMLQLAKGKSRLSKLRQLYSDISVDLLAIRNTLAAQTSMSTGVIREKVQTLQAALLLQQVDLDAMTEAADTITEKAVALELDTNMDALADLRGSIQTYTRLVSLCDSLRSRQNGQTELTARLNATDALDDAEASWNEVRGIWSGELAALRAELAASPLETRGDWLKKIDTLSGTYLNCSGLIERFATIAGHPRQNGLRNVMPSFYGILLALILDISASASVFMAAELRRQRAQAQAVFPADTTVVR